MVDVLCIIVMNFKEPMATKKGILFVVDFRARVDHNFFLYRMFNENNIL